MDVDTAAMDQTETSDTNKFMAREVEIGETNEVMDEGEINEVMDEGVEIKELER